MNSINDHGSTEYDVENICNGLVKQQQIVDAFVCSNISSNRSSCCVFDYAKWKLPAKTKKPDSCGSNNSDSKETMKWKREFCHLENQSHNTTSPVLSFLPCQNYHDILCGQSAIYASLWTGEHIIATGRPLSFNLTTDILSEATQECFEVFQSNETLRSMNDNDKIRNKDEDEILTKLLSVVIPESQYPSCDNNYYPNHDDNKMSKPAASICTVTLPIETSEHRDEADVNRHDKYNIMSSGSERVTKHDVNNYDDHDDGTTVTDITGTTIITTNEEEEDDDIEDKEWLAAAVAASKILPQKKKTVKMIKRVPRWVFATKSVTTASTNTISSSHKSAAFNAKSTLLPKKISSGRGAVVCSSPNGGGGFYCDENNSVVSDLYSEADVDDDDCLPEATIQVLGDIFDGIGGIDDDGDNDKNSTKDFRFSSSSNNSNNSSCASLTLSLPATSYWKPLKKEQG